jgi:hypothetical protein
VTDAYLREIFQSVGLVDGCKLIRKEKVVSLMFSVSAVILLLEEEYGSV